MKPPSSFIRQNNINKAWGFHGSWLALAAGPKNRVVRDNMLPKPYLQKVMWRFPAFMWPPFPEEGYILGLDLNGTVKYNLQDPDGGFYPNTTSAIEVNGMLYLGRI